MAVSNKSIWCHAEGVNNMILRGQKIFRVRINIARIGEKNSPHCVSLHELAAWAHKCDWLTPAERTSVIDRARKHFTP